jgi:hypothetical protein
MGVVSGVRLSEMGKQEVQQFAFVAFELKGAASSRSMRAETVE